jgi:hypothetical protein
MHKIGTLLVLIVLIMLGVAVFAVSVALVRRQASEARKLREPD